MLLCMPWWIYEENLPLAFSFCPGSLSVAGTCSPNMVLCLSYFTESVTFADLCGWYKFVLIFSDSSSWCIALQTVPSLFSQIYNNEGNTVRIDGVPERSVSQAVLPRHLNGVCQPMQALRLSKHCHSFPPVLGIWIWSPALSDRFGLVLWSLFSKAFVFERVTTS